MAIPLKNGVTIFLPEYNEYRRADVYQIAGTTVFVMSAAHSHMGDFHATVLIGSEGILRSDGTYAILIVPNDAVVKHVSWEHEFVIERDGTYRA